MLDNSALDRPTPYPQPGIILVTAFDQ